LQHDISSARGLHHLATRTWTRGSPRCCPTDLSNQFAL
jgi:hypothetical protein